MKDIRLKVVCIFLETITSISTYYNDLDKSSVFVLGKQNKVTTKGNNTVNVYDNENDLLLGFYKEYTEYIAENLEKNLQYSEYLAENLEKTIKYSEYLAGSVDLSETEAQKAKRIRLEREKKLKRIYGNSN